MPLVSSAPHTFIVEEDEVLPGFGDAGYYDDPYTALVNHGEITEGDWPEAIFLDGFYFGFDVFNYGDIGEGGRAMWAYDSDIFLYNVGNIFGDFYLLSSSLNLINMGNVIGDIYVTEEFGAYPVVIENSGVISSPDTYSVISGSYYKRDIVENWGEIEGDIYTWGGSDWVYNYDGVIDGDVWLDIGDDIYEADDGTVTGTVLGEGGNDNLTGGRESDTLSGGIGRDVINGGGGNDHLMGGRHYDVLTGGEGRDVFEFQRGYGGEYITDFENNRDTLLFDEGIWGGGLTPAQLLERYASTEGDVTTIDFGGRDVITLEGIDDYRLLANDIVFEL